MPRINKPANTLLPATIAVALSGAAKAQKESAHIADEIIVTATNRSANMQDIAVPVQGLTGDMLEKLGVSNFDEYAQFLSNRIRGRTD